MPASLVLATWNVNSIRKREEVVTKWVNLHRPHVLLLQETKVVDQEFPLSLFDNLGYEIAIHGQKAYNGVAIASRCGLEDVAIGMPDFHDEQARVIAATVSGTRVLSVYAPNGGDQQKYDHKMAFYSYLCRYLKDLREEHGAVVAGGDYNVAPRDEDVYDIEDYGRNSIAVRPGERQAYASVLDCGYVDAHMKLGGAAHDHTWWDYRASSFQNNKGLRIDHFLVSGGSCDKIKVDREPRGWATPSDHTPVVLEFSA